MPNLNFLTLASHNKFSRSPTLSPLQFPYEFPSFTSQTRLDDMDDFQSNASSRSGLHFGLGIMYPQTEFSTNASNQNHRIAFADAIPSFSQQRTAIKSELDNPTMGLQGELSYFYDSRIIPSWSLSSEISSYSPSSFGAINSPSQGRIPTHPDLNFDMTTSTVNSTITTSEIFVDGQADQLPGTTDFSLQRIPSSLSSGLYSLASVSSVYNYGSLPPETSATTDAWKGMVLAVDLSEPPSDCISEYDMPQALILPELHPCLEIPFQSSDSTIDTHSKDQYVSSGAVSQPRVVLGHLEGAARYEVFLPPVKMDDDDGDYRFSDFKLETRSLSSSSFPSPYQKRLTRNSKRSQAVKTKSPTFLLQRKQKNTRQKIEVIADVLQRTPVQDQESGIGIDFGTPVLNAHLGIGLDELLSRAERYRLRNPGRIYDNNWLASFAGRVSERGEYIKGYRCYVEGCSQDLLKRHSARAHGTQTARKRKGIKGEEKENNPIPSKRVKRESAVFTPTL
ncbi:hypothetical protein H0H87_011731 [Tephrocybe sp. NHM501043]|nr:hypothetical protein H0H87_011731 [Tephrocybe sp. NHM501043]